MATSSDTPAAKSIDAVDLQKLLNYCIEDEPRLAELERFAPHDPRDVVLVSLGQRMVRVFPGVVAHPVGNIERALLVADAVDEFLIAHNGFGVRDLLEVGLGYADMAIEALKLAWTEHNLREGAELAVSELEFGVAKHLIELGTPDELAQTERHRQALEWVTCEVGGLPYQPLSGGSTFGRFMRVRSANGAAVRWLPLAFLPETLNSAVQDLAAEAAGYAGALHRFAEMMAIEVRRTLWPFSALVDGPEPTNDSLLTPLGNEIRWVSRSTDRRALLVQIDPRLRSERTQLQAKPEALRVAQTLEDNPDQPAQMVMPGCYGVLPANTDAAPLLLHFWPDQATAQRGLPDMTLDDLRWISNTIDSHTDLFAYCRDIVDAAPLPPLGWGAVELWEWWRANQKRFANGQRPSTAATSGIGKNQWRNATDNHALEKSLFQLKLPPLRIAAGVTRFQHGPLVVHHYATPPRQFPGGRPTQLSTARIRPHLLWRTLHVSNIPVAIEVAETDWSAEEVRTIRDIIPGVFGVMLGATEPTWSTAHSGTKIVGYRLKLLPSPPIAGASMLSWTEISDESVLDGTLVKGTLRVDWTAIAEAEAASAGAAQNVMAQAVEDLLANSGIDSHMASSVGAAWRSAPRVFTAQLVWSPTTRNELGPPIRLDAALAAQVTRSVADAIRAADVRPGRYVGQQAKELDRDVLAPAALGALLRKLSVHNMDELVLFGMRELERCHEEDRLSFSDILHMSTRLSLEWDPAATLSELEAEHYRLRRCCETVVEAALRAAPTGTLSVDHVAWGEVLAAAGAYLDVTTRSESVHHQVNPAFLQVGESWEVSAGYDPSLATAESASGRRVYNIDTDAFAQARIAESLEGNETHQEAMDASHSECEATGCISSGRSHGTVADSAQAVVDDAAVESIVSLNDALIDAAMSDAYGASGSDVLITLFALAAWPVGPNDGEVVVVPASGVVDHVLGITKLGSDPDGQSKVEAALTLLTSTHAGLASDDWKPWQARSRKRRIIAQPLPKLPNGELVIAPHTCMGAFGVYRRYLQQGLLPWSQPDPPPNVARALEKFRERKNRELERRVASTLKDAGWTVVERIKKGDGKRLNIPRLRSEVDAVAGRTGTRTIWLLEVKDPSEVFVTAEARRALDRFFGNESVTGHNTLLQQKYEDLAPYAVDVAAALRLPRAPDEAPYIVKPMYVTRFPVLAAFADCPFPFSTLRGLTAALDDEGL
jgi:hypothetical protein